MHVTTLVLASLAAGTVAWNAPAPARPDVLDQSFLDFPVPAQALEVPQEETMMNLVRSYARATGQVVVVDEETRGFLEQTEVGASEGLTVPPERVQETVEALLVEHDFLLHVLTAGSPRLLGVTALQSGARNTVRSLARFVPQMEVEVLAAHPAMLFTTIVHLPNTDVRQLSNSMRTMITDANTMQMLPMGNTSSLLLVGPGGYVAQLVEMLTEADARAALDGPPAPPAAQEGGQKGEGN